MNVNVVNFVMTTAEKVENMETQAFLSSSSPPFQGECFVCQCCLRQIVFRVKTIIFPLA